MLTVRSCKRIMSRSERVSRMFLSTVAEKTVNVTFVNLQGQKKTVPGLIGMSILEVAKMHGVELDGPCGGGGAKKYIRRTERFVEDDYGEGPMCNMCHILVSKKWYDKMNEVFEDEQELLEDIAYDLYQPGASRLGCQVYLTKELDGMTVHISDGPVVDD